MEYTEGKYPFQDETYEIIGICMEVHRILGKGLLEIVYKDAIEYELQMRNIPYSREKKYIVEYKDVIFYVITFLPILWFTMILFLK